VGVPGARTQIFPCAFPVGLPKRITSPIVKEYEILLRSQLMQLAHETKRRSSSLMSEMAISGTRSAQRMKAAVARFREKQQREPYSLH